MKKKLNSSTTPSCRNPEKPKNRQKTGFFGLQRLYCKKFLHEFDKIWLNDVKDTFAPKYEKKLNSPTTPSCRNPEKPKNRQKTGVFGLPRLHCKKFLHEFDENWLNGVKDIFAPKYEKRN